jgi:hypothetical protein
MSILSVLRVERTAIELEIDEQIRCGIGDESLRDTAMEKVPKEQVPFKGVVFCQSLDNKRTWVRRFVAPAFTRSPLKDLAFGQPVRLRKRNAIAAS